MSVWMVGTAGAAPFFQARPAAVKPGAVASVRLADDLAEFDGSPDPRHVVLQFEAIVDPDARRALAEAGVTLQRYAGDATYIAVVEGHRLDRRHPVLQRRALRGPLTLERKRHPEMVAGRFPERARLPRPGTRRWVAAYVMFHADVPLAAAREVVRGLGGVVQSGLPSAHALVIEIPEAAVDALAADERTLWIEPPLPPFDVVNDANRAITQADIVQGPPQALTGAGVTVLVYDGGSAESDHPDFGGRLTRRDTDGLSNHATHVAGTVGGDGVSSGGVYRGMAPAVEIVSYGFERDDPDLIFLYEDPGDLEVDYQHAVHVFGADVANNSIGTNTCRNNFDCAITGDYGVTSAVIDGLVAGSLGAPFRIVWSNGNERTPSCTRCRIAGVHTPEGYHSTAPPSCAKNAIAVGALNADDDSMTDFSSWGPCDDGRVKPDVSAPGCQIGDDAGVTSCCYISVFTLSCDDPDAGTACCQDDDGDGFGYTALCGTSMAAPTVTGLAALVLEAHRAALPAEPDPSNATLKTLFAHNAADLGTPGPDYRSGYGAVRVADTIAFLESGRFARAEVDHAGSAVFFVDVAPLAPAVRVTLAWDDVPGLPSAANALVNDLDLEVHGPDGTRYFPWTLDPTVPGMPAVQSAADHTNNIEQVHVDLPEPGRWRVAVVGHAVPFGPQPFTVAATPALSRDCNGNEIPDPEELADGSASDCTGNGILDECEPDCDGNGVADSCDLADGLYTDCNGDGVPDETACDPFRDCNGNGVHDACDIAAGVSADCNHDFVPDACQDCNNSGLADECDLALRDSADCNGTGIPDECELASGASVDCNANDVPDECEADCNENGVVDVCDIAAGTSADCNGNDIPDACELTDGVLLDCNGNSGPDVCDIVSGISADCDDDGVPDECQLDCNANGQLDVCDVIYGISPDADGNGVPDECLQVWHVPADFATIQGAIDAAGDGDSIILADGIYSGPGNRDLTLGGRNMTIRSANGPATCIVDAGGAGRGFHLDGTVTRSTLLHGLTIRNGQAATGGALLLDGASPRIVDCVLTANGAQDFGGAINAINSAALIQRCTITDNLTSFFGGGISAANGDIVIEDCVIAGNRATQSPLAGEGGGLYLFGARPQVRRCLIAGNTARYFGGGVYAWDTETTLASNTVVANVADVSGGNVSLWSSATVVIDSTIVWGGSASVGADLHLAGDVDCLVQYGVLAGGAAAAFLQQNSTLTIGTDVALDTPGFVDSEGPDGDPLTWADNDYHLAAGSQAIDLGNPAVPVTAATDLDGEPRVQGGRIDAGFDEVAADCDGNGLSDVVDIAAGAPDCNTNLVPDACELAGGAVDDLNGNGIPDSCECEFDPPPALDHVRMCEGGAYADFLFDRVVVASGYVDPRRATFDGQTAQFGLDAVTLIFSEPVRAVGGGPLTPADFEISETGGAAPPVVTTVLVDPHDPTRVRVELDRLTTWQEWTVVQALVEDACGHPIIGTGPGGPGALEPDRVDIAVLPGDVDGNGRVEPADLLRLRQSIAGIYQADCLPPYMVADLDRDGDIDFADLVEFRDLTLELWGGAVLLNDQP